MKLPVAPGEKILAKIVIKIAVALLKLFLKVEENILDLKINCSKWVKKFMELLEYLAL